MQLCVTYIMWNVSREKLKAQIFCKQRFSCGMRNLCCKISKGVVSLLYSFPVYLVFYIMAYVVFYTMNS